MTPYRPAPGAVPTWLARLSILREFQRYRRRVGGTWVRLWAHLLPGGGYEWWYSEKLDPAVRMYTLVMKREFYEGEA